MANCGSCTMKVLQILDYYRPYGSGGAQWSVCSLAEGLKSAEVTIFTLAPEWGTPESQDSYGSFMRFFMPVRPKRDSLIAPFWLSNPLFWLWSSLSILSTIATKRPEVIHVHGKYMIPGALLAGVIARKKTVVTVRDYVPLCPYALCLFDMKTRHKNLGKFLTDEMPKYQALYGKKIVFNYLFVLISGMWGVIYAEILRWCLYRATRVIYLSKTHASIYRRSGYPNGMVIGNRCVVNAKNTSPKESTNTVLYAGKVSYGKGLDILLQAWKEIYKKHPKWKLVLCGEGPLLNRAIGKGIVVKGEVTHEELIREYQRAMFTIVPSVWPEPFGRVVIESVLSGTPVLVSRRTGTAVFVEHYKAGWVVHANLDSLVDGIQRAINEAPIVRRYIAKQKERLATFWDRNIVDAHKRLYRSLL